MTSKSSNLDGTGHSAALRRRAPPSMDPPTPHNWRAQLNDLLGAASRRLFQSQLVLRSASEREIRAELPEVCAFAASVCRAAAVSSEQRRAIREAFSDPQVQWLSRGAVESGASGFFCHLLLRGTAAVGHGDGASRCVVQILLDPVLKSCYERVGESGRANATCACEWRYEKPQYYAMACANLWETLLPFIARAARQHADVFGDVLSKQLHAKHPRSHGRVNCRFAQVAGFWRLLEAVGDAKTLDHTPVVKELLPKLLTFVVRWSVLSEEEEEEEEESEVSAAVTDAWSDPHAKFHDLLLEKFFHDMQAFLFKCAHATRVARVALESTLRRHLSMTNSLGSSAVLSPHCVRFAAFAAAACILVKGLGKKASELIKAHRSVSLSTPDHRSFLLVVGMVSHIESIDVGTVLAVLHELLDRYEKTNDSPTERREVLMWVVYIIVSRQRSLNPNMNNETGEFRCLQERICLVDMEDLQLMPLHWMETVWKVCLGLDDDEVEAFITESRAFRVSLVQRGDGTSPLAWEDLIHRVPLRRLDQYPSMLAILGEPFADSIKQTNLPSALIDDDVLHVLSQKKKRRRVRRDVVLLSEEHEASRQNALLLPDVMERIASFMSAKRLCRLSLVCHAFAGVARSPRLWKPLYVQLVEPLKITCRHGASYEHDWRQMYQAKYGAVKKMQNRQRAMARKAQRIDSMAFCWHEDGQELRMSVAVHSAQLCRECGCNQLSSTSEAATSHRQLHRKYRCPQPLCREALTSAAALKQHMKTNHPAPPTRKDMHHEVEKVSTSEQDKTHVKSEFKCSISGCARSYKSLKWLQNHLTRVHGGGDLQGGPDEVAAIGTRGE